MKVQLESTDRLVNIIINGVQVPGRIWEGATEHGIAVFACITRIAAPETEDQVQFLKDLQEHSPPSTQAVDAFPIRMVL